MALRWFEHLGGIINSLLVGFMWHIFLGDQRTEMTRYFLENREVTCHQHYEKRPGSTDGIKETANIMQIFKNWCNVEFFFKAVQDHKTPPFWNPKPWCIRENVKSISSSGLCDSLLFHPGEITASLTGKYVSCSPVGFKLWVFRVFYSKQTPLKESQSYSRTRPNMFWGLLEFNVMINTVFNPASYIRKNTDNELEAYFLILPHKENQDQEQSKVLCSTLLLVMRWKSSSHKDW